MNPDRRRLSRDAFSLRVVKVGGSLLAWPGLPTTLQAWLADQPVALNVLLCGGGSLADAIRCADRNFDLGEEASHALCIEVLGVTARLLAALLKGTPVAATYDDLLARLGHLQQGAIVLDPRSLVAGDGVRFAGEPLPHCWDVTSDSIAAHAAAILGADELVLLKSADPPPAATRGDLAAGGYVDRHFPLAAAGIPSLRLVNLRRALQA
jgi:5-(aminomethyl)-3-furanmethanol phosphate kinase